MLLVIGMSIVYCKMHLKYTCKIRDFLNVSGI